MMKISEDIRLKDIINKYDVTSDGTLYQDLIKVEEKIQKPDIIIPVLGTQGTGKSTMINAYLGDDIMPSEADETTCIPVEVRYGNEKTEVHFADNKVKTINNNKDELAQYVDNRFNPGNEKNVSFIIVYNEYEVLKDGVVIVDLPGVASLTKANEEATMRYIEDLCAAVFIIPTCPPIIKTQASFIKSVWRVVSSAFFVQNVWDDNRKDEIEEGLSANRNILNSIADEINVELKNDVIPVNAYKAAKGTFTDDLDLVKESNIDVMKSCINDFAASYVDVINNDFNNRIKKVVEYITYEIEKRIDQSKLSKEELLQALNDEKRRFAKSSNDMERAIDAIEDAISTYKRESNDFVEELVNKKTNLLQTEINHLIDSGVVDGEKLRDAFSDYQNLYATEAVDETYDELSQVNEKLSELLAEVQDVVDKEMMGSVETTEFYKEQSLKWEKGAKVGFDIAGGVGGFILGEMAAETVVGMAALGSAAGPVGTAVGIAVGIVVAVGAGLIGSGIKKYQGKRRAEETKQEIRASVNEFKDYLRKSLNNSFKEYYKEVLNNLETFRESRQEYLDVLNQRIGNITRNGNELENRVSELNRDLDYIRKVEI